MLFMARLCHLRSNPEARWFVCGKKKEKRLNLVEHERESTKSRSGPSRRKTESVRYVLLYVCSVVMLPLMLQTNDVCKRPMSRLQTSHESFANVKVVCHVCICHSYVCKLPARRLQTFKYCGYLSCVQTTLFCKNRAVQS